MNVLYELIDLLPKSFTPQFSKQLNELYSFLLKNKKLTVKEAARLFLKSDGKRNYFNKLKQQLKNQLIDHILVSPPVWANKEYKLLHDTCFKQFATYKILLVSGSGQAAIELGRKLLEKVDAIELYALAFEITADLQFYYSSMKTSPGLCKKYGDMVDKNASLIKIEAKVRKYHSRVATICNTRNSFTPTMIDEFVAAAIDTAPLLKLGSNKIGRLIYNIIVASHYVKYDYEKVLSACKEALAYFSPEHPNYTAFRFSFLQKQIPAMIALSRLEEAKAFAKEAGQMMPAGTFNWHLVFMQRLIICLHAGTYQEAYDLYKAQSKHGCKYQTLFEYWNIMKGYLYFLIQQERIISYTKERFNLGKFLNEVPLYSSDKAGININMLILQVLIQMQRGQFGKIIDQVESLSVYARKYTRNPETARANIFINMIVKMEKASFHRISTERKTKKLLEKLKATPLSLGQSLAVEIIPYEFLWNEILNMLDNKFRATTTKKVNT